MKTKRIDFKIIVYESEDKGLEKYTAHCLSLDIIFDAKTVNEALIGILELISCSVCSAKKHKSNIFHSAGHKWWSMFNESENIDTEDLHK